MGEEPRSMLEVRLVHGVLSGIPAPAIMCRLWRLHFQNHPEEALDMKREKRHPGEAMLARAGLAGEHALTDVGQVVLFLAFLGIWVSDSFLFRYSLFGAALPLYVRIPLCAAALAGSMGLALPAHKAIFGDTHREPGVVRTGVYSRVRHPMYLGSWLVPVGLAIATGSLASIAVCGVMLAFYLYVSRCEERLLLEKHGAEYREYMARVPMLFPLRLRRKSAAG
jgi:protein-S-isoprenylcysteine O-methyltransferase Ste14